MSADKRIPNPAQLPLFDPVVIKLTKGYETIVDPIDADLAVLKWSVDSSPTHSTRYARRNAGGRWERMHRRIAARMVGRDLHPKECVDHIDGNGLNNQRSNLRVGTQKQNVWNTRRNTRNTSGYKGVSYTRQNGKWMAYCSKDGHRHYLGYFDTAEEAYAAYCKAAKELHGEYARLE